MKLQNVQMLRITKPVFNVRLSKAVKQQSGLYIVHRHTRLVEQLALTFLALDIREFAQPGNQELLWLRQP